MAKKKNVTSDDKAVDELMETITKAHGAGSVIVGDAIVRDIETVSTGSVAIDIALGVGGYPKGRIVEIFGPESSGKTTLALHAVANTQKNGGRAAYIDAEHALDPTWATAIGVDMDKLLLSQPNSGEEALQIAEKMVESGIINTIVVDSVAALVPQAELDGEIGDKHIGLQARLMGQAMRKLSALVSKHKCIIIFINQIRDKIGGFVMAGQDNTTTSGGRALKFYASVRLEIKRIGSVGATGKQTANKIKVKVVKNKVAPPFRLAEFEIAFGFDGISGINNYATLFDFGLNNKVFEKSGAWIAHNENRIGNGREAAIKWLSTNKELSDQLETQMRLTSLKERVVQNISEDDLVDGNVEGESDNGGDS